MYSSSDHGLGEKQFESLFKFLSRIVGWSLCLTLKLLKWFSVRGTRVGFKFIASVYIKALVIRLSWKPPTQLLCFTVASLLSPGPSSRGIAALFGLLRKQAARHLWTSVVNPTIFLSDLDPQIHNSVLPIRIRNNLIYYLHFFVAIEKYVVKKGLNH